MGARKAFGVGKSRGARWLAVVVVVAVVSVAAAVQMTRRGVTFAVVGCSS